MVKCNLKAKDVETMSLNGVNNLIMYVSCALQENKREHAQTQYNKWCAVMDAAIKRKEQLEGSEAV